MRRLKKNNFFLPILALLFWPVLALAEDTTLDFANGLYSRGMYGPAAIEYEKFIKENPASPEIVSARFRLADSHYFIKKYESAVSYFEAFIKDFPTDSRAPMALFRVGASKLHLGDQASALRIFQKIFKNEMDPNLKSGALFYLAQIYQATGKEAENIKALQNLVQEYPYSEYTAYASLVLGDHYLNKSKAQQALAYYKITAEKTMPQDVVREAQFKAAEIYFSGKNFKRAAVYYERLFTAEPQGSLSDAQKKRWGELKEKSLLALFHCDYNSKNLDSATQRFDLNKTFIDASPYKAEIEYLVAGLLAETQNDEAALEMLDDILTRVNAKDPLVDRALFKKAQIYSAAGDKDAALGELQKIIASASPSAPRAHFERAEILKELGRLPEALAAYQAVPEPGFENYFKEALYQTGSLYLKAQDPPKAKESLTRFVEKYPVGEDTERAYLKIVQIDLDAKNLESAARFATKFVTDFPQSALHDIACYKLGICLTGLKQFKEAAEAFKTVVEKYPASKLHAESTYGAAGGFENAGQIKEAISYYESLVKNYPDHALTKGVLPRLGALYIQVEDFEKARSFYEDILVNKKDIPVQTDAVFWLIHFHLDNNRFEDAQKILVILPERFPGEDLQHEINFFHGETERGLKDFQKAIEYYAKAVELKPEGRYAPYAYLGAGLSYLASGNDSLAETHFNEAIRFDNEPKAAARARLEIANLRLKAGDVLEAAKAYMLVAILFDDPQCSAQALYKAGGCFTTLHQTEEAAKAFEELKTRYPGSEWALKLNE